MDNIVVNSALWYAGQCNQFLINSGADRLIGKGFNYYAVEAILLSNKLVKKRTDCRRRNERRACCAVLGGICRQLLAVCQDRV